MLIYIYEKKHDKREKKHKAGIEQAIDKTRPLHS